MLRPGQPRSCAPCLPPQVGDRLKSRDELRAEWEAFQKKQKSEALEASVNYRGVYVFKLDATGGRVARGWVVGWVSGRWRMLRHMPTCPHAQLLCWSASAPSAGCVAAACTPHTHIALAS